MNPQQIKQWLKQSGHDRQWLAGNCGVSKSTVDGWLSPNGARNIPKPSQSIIAALMYKEKPIEPRFTVEQYARIQKAAKNAGMEVDQWIEQAIISLATNI